MGVYINMEMPTSCLECRLYNDPWCMAKNRNQWRTAYNRPPKGERQNDCPLVPVPPHGRLIDGDVAEAITVNFDEAKGDFWDGILYAADFISKQPTIVPAEESE